MTLTNLGATVSNILKIETTLGSRIRIPNFAVLYTLKHYRNLT